MYLMTSSENRELFARSDLNDSIIPMTLRLFKEYCKLPLISLGLLLHFHQGFSEGLREGLISKKGDKPLQNKL